MDSVSTIRRGHASVNFRRAALAVRWSVKANYVVRIRSMHAQAALKDNGIEVIKSDPIQPCTEEPALKTESRPLAALQSFSHRQLNASVKFRRAAIIVRLAVIAKKSNPRPTILEPRIKPEIEAPEIEEEKEILDAKPKTSFKFRQAAIAVEFFLKANRLIHQADCEVEYTSQQETLNIIDVALNCIEDSACDVTPIEVAALRVDPIADTSLEVAPIEEAAIEEAPIEEAVIEAALIEEAAIEAALIEEAVIEVTAMEVEKTQEVAEVTDEEEPELQLFFEGFSDSCSSDLTCTFDSSSPTKVKKSVTMKKKTSIRKIPTRNSYTEEEVASAWYSRPDLQKMHDKLSEKMRASGIAAHNFWVLDGVFVPSSKPQKPEKAPKKKRHSSSSSTSKSSKPQEGEKTPKKKSRSSSSSISKCSSSTSKTSKSSKSFKSSKPQEGEKAPKKKRQPSPSSTSKKEKGTSSSGTKGSSKVKKSKSLPDIGINNFPILSINVHQVQVSNRAA